MDQDPLGHLFESYAIGDNCRLEIDIVRVLKQALIDARRAAGNHSDLHVGTVRLAVADTTLRTPITDCIDHRVLGTGKRRPHDTDRRAVAAAITARKSRNERVAQFARLLQGPAQRWFVNSRGWCFTDNKHDEQAMPVLVAE